MAALKTCGQAGSDQLKRDRGLPQTKTKLPSTKNCPDWQVEAVLLGRHLDFGPKNNLCKKWNDTCARLMEVELQPKLILSLFQKKLPNILLAVTVLCIT